MDAGQIAAPGAALDSLGHEGYLTAKQPLAAGRFWPTADAQEQQLGGNLIVHVNSPDACGAGAGQP